MSTSLFSLTGQYLALAHQLADSDFDAQTIADTIESTGINDEISVKVSSIEYVARGAEAHNAAIDAEIARLTALKTHRTRTAQALRDYIKRSMEALAIEKIDCPMFCISVRKNPPAVDIFDADQLPAEFMVLPVPKPPVAAPSKTLIAAQLKAGKDVPGARLTQSTRLVVA